MTYKDNTLYLDITKLEHKMTNHKKKVKLLLGEFIENDDFRITVETIKNLPEDEQKRVRSYIKSIFVS
jgi:uncharacterized protein YeeX (DUF496 family)